MKLGSTRSLEGLKPVLKNKTVTSPDPVYWVFPELSPSGRWVNLTVIVPDLIDGEYPKTYGHYHGVDTLETYHLVGGSGILQMQKKHFENGVFIPEIVDEVFLVSAKPGDEIIITPEYGHSWSNVGLDVPLVSWDDWRSGHTPADYEPMKKLVGLAYYLIDDNGKPKAVPNPNYKNLPEPIWLTAEEFRTKEVTKK